MPWRLANKINDDRPDQSRRERHAAFPYGQDLEGILQMARRGYKRAHILIARRRTPTAAYTISVVDVILIER